MAIDGYDLRERPWQPGLDDARFNQQPRNPNFTGGASPQADAYQRANGLRGMDAVERPWSGADTKAFGTRPAGVAPSIGERVQGAANTVRAGYARTTGNAAHFGPQPAAAPSPGGVRGKLAGAASAAGGFLGKVGIAGGAGYGAYEAASGLADGDYTRAGLGAADAVASASLATPAAPVGATWLGARAAHGAIQGAVDKYDLGDTIGGTINQIGLRTGLWGVDGSAYLQQKAQERMGQPAAQPPTPTSPRTADLRVRPEDTFAGPDARYANPGAIAAAQTQASAPTNQVTRVGNSYSGSNVAGDISINGQAPGGGSISPQNMAAADTLAAR